MKRILTFGDSWVNGSGLCSNELYNTEQIQGFLK